MQRNLFLIIITMLTCVISPPAVQCQGNPALAGKWELIRDQSTDIDHLGTLTLEFTLRAKQAEIIQQWGARSRRGVRDSLVVTPGGAPVDLPVTNWVFPSNIFMGVRMPVGDKRHLSASWEDGGDRLRIEETCLLRTSQGKVRVTTTHSYQLTQEKDILTYRVSRSTRKTGPDVQYVLKKAGARQGFSIRLDDNWDIGGKLPVNALLISLQGLANRTAPRVYLLYPDNWPFTYVNHVFDFYKTRRYYTFKELKTPVEALQALKGYAKGYVVWDKSVRTSLIVAFTAAGLDDAAVVSEEQIPWAESAGLKCLEDFRGTFKGMSDARIYAWAYDRYWKRCSREFIVWLGGEHGQTMRPAVADWGMHQRVFFSDLSCRLSDTAEYALAQKLLSEMKPMSMVMGWHSYAKDLEEEFVTLTSHFGHRVEGLNTLPNLSFSAQIPASPGFTFKNNHHVKPGEHPTPGKKVYITCIQTDGMGLGAWEKPGRGEIPYAWEVLMNYTWMAPGMAEYFYSTATPNDYMIGCLSGPGYLYPKAVPKKYLPDLLRIARDQMKTLDLRVFETMDWSEGSEVEGNTDLQRSIVNDYYSNMPEAIGFVNGYGPGYTFTVKDGRPFVSYDYYLSPVRPENVAVADLQELAAMNTARPYFLLVHVREWSDVKRVKGILDKLGSEFEVVPLDVFLAMAGANPTYEERFLEE